MISTAIVYFVKGVVVSTGLFLTLLLLMDFFMAVSDVASADMPVRSARLSEQDRSVSGSQHIPGGTHDHEFDYLMYQIAAHQNDVDDSTPSPMTSQTPESEDDALEKIRETGGL